MPLPGGPLRSRLQGTQGLPPGGGAKPGAHGRILRVDPDSHDRCIVTPTPRGSHSWRRGHNRRSAMGRIDSRLDRAFNFETRYIRGRARMKTRVGLAQAVMMATARAQVLAGQRMRSLVGAVEWRDTG